MMKKGLLYNIFKGALREVIDSSSFIFLNKKKPSQRIVPIDSIKLPSPQTLLSEKENAWGAYCIL